MCPDDKRKCRDILCLILFTGFWGFCFYLIYSFSLWNYAENALVLVQPFDSYRRRCGSPPDATGLPGINQPDRFSFDYSKIILDPTIMSTFCTLAKVIYPTITQDCTIIGKPGKANVTATRTFFSSMNLYS